MRPPFKKPECESRDCEACDKFKNGAQLCRQMEDEEQRVTTIIDIFKKLDSYFMEGGNGRRR